MCAELMTCLTSTMRCSNKIIENICSTIRLILNLDFRFYGGNIRAYEILGGKVERPPECAELYDVLDKHNEMFKRALAAQAKSYAKREVEKQADARGYGGFVSRVKVSV